MSNSTDSVHDDFVHRSPGNTKIGKNVFFYTINHFEIHRQFQKLSSSEQMYLSGVEMWTEEKRIGYAIRYYPSAVHCYNTIFAETLL